jgi:predicted MFS family arabinose efflux permease
MFVAGFCAFLDIYAPQSVLPELSSAFGVSATAAASTVGITTLAVAGSAPVVGAIGERLGRKTTLVGATLLLVLPTLYLALAQGMQGILLARFLQGLLLPAIFSSAVAFISEDWKGSEAASVVGIYQAGAVLGGFAGRLVTALASDSFGWRGGFFALTAVTLLAGLALLAWLPNGRPLPASGKGLRGVFGDFARHLHNRTLIAACVIGSSMLFSMVGAMTYISFRMAAPPFSFGPKALGAIFISYLFGAAGPWLSTVGLRHIGARGTLAVSTVLCAVGLIVTLSTNLVWISIGLVVFVVAGFISATNTLSLIGRVSGQAKASAIGLYICTYYIGGSLGAILPGKPFEWAGWPACVALLVAVMVTATAAVLPFWKQAD